MRVVLNIGGEQMAETTEHNPLRGRHDLKIVVWALIVTSSLLAIGPARTLAMDEGTLEPGMVNPGYQEFPDWFKDSFLEIRQDIEDSAQNNKRLILYFYQDGCPYCKKLVEDNFGQRQITDKTQQYFDLVAINMWGDREVIDFYGKGITEKQFAKNLRVMFTPTLLMLDEDAKVILRINGYYPSHKFLAALDFVGLKREDQTSFREYLAKSAPEAASGRLHLKPGYLQPPYRLGERLKQGSKPLMVLFEQRQCVACDELHLDILEREESKRFLNSFDVVLLDIWSKEPLQTPEGLETVTSNWARALSVNYAPSMIFFNQQGEEVFRTEAYLKAFHVQSVMEYVASQAYLKQPEFQRYIQTRAEVLRAKGIELNLME